MGLVRAPFIYLCQPKRNKMKYTSINELITLLNSAAQIARDNIQNAHNYDLEDLCQVLESHVEELESIGEFKQFDDC
jgi:hypothetical protein